MGKMGKMGKRRKPCCVKSEVKRGPWSPGEDVKLMTYVQNNGHSNWRTLPKKADLQRCGKSCRLRWINYLRPDVKRGNFTIQEEDTIIKLHRALGNKWSAIASQLPGRTDNEIKNVWNTHLKKRLSKYDTNSITSGPNQPSSAVASSSSSTTTLDYSSGRRNSMEKGNGDGMDQENTKKSPQDPEIIVTYDELEKVQNPQLFNQFVSSRSNIGMGDLPMLSPTFSSNNSILTHQELHDLPNPGFDEAIIDSIDFHFLGDHHEDGMSNLLGEVNQLLNTTTTTTQENVLLENPLDPNRDIWKIIEDMEPSELQHQIDEAAAQTAAEKERKKWMIYLENQLDLDDNDDLEKTSTKMGDDQQRVVQENLLLKDALVDDQLQLDQSFDEYEWLLKTTNDNNNNNNYIF